MKKVLITSALPYVNNIPHLGNLIQVLSADVYARYCRLRGYETLYICGTDEYGTATETRALEEGITPRELCDRYFTIHSEVYRWFAVSFDKFGRTSTRKHIEITQGIFLKLEENGYITEKRIEQAFCERCGRFLADRYVLGSCPHCRYPEARGDQCESCGKLLDPMELVEPRCSVCGTAPVVRESTHLYIDLPKILPKLKRWMEKASLKGAWARNAVQMTQAWIRDGLQERCITRDLKWGIPVPKKGFEDKVFYVWFDAPIGYISITASLTDRWQDWWRRPEEVKLVQFIGKDNIPFHTVIFPCSQLGTGETWTMLSNMSSTEYLNYESGKFSKSKGTGVFGTDAKETGIPADVWRFYIYYNRPEKADFLFTWKDFQEKVNSELIGNLANLVNRTLTFVCRNYDCRLPEGKPDLRFWDAVRKAEREIADLLEKVELREAFRRIFALSSLGNKRFQDEEPWKKAKGAPAAASGLLHDLVYLIRDLAVLLHPFLPETSKRLLAFLQVPKADWVLLGSLEGVQVIQAPQLLFKRLEDKEIEQWRVKYAGVTSTPAALSPRDAFKRKVCLKVGRILEVERHPQADKLYIEKVDLGDGEIRQIVSGLVPYYREEELKGRNIVLVVNLKAASLRGVESQGMLLAAEDEETVEVLFVDKARPGDRVRLEGDKDAGEEPGGEIDIEEFFRYPMEVRQHQVLFEGIPLLSAGSRLTTDKVKTGKVR